jgi:hypothetical protein
MEARGAGADAGDDKRSPPWRQTFARCEPGDRDAAATLRLFRVRARSGSGCPPGGAGGHGPRREPSASARR